MSHDLKTPDTALNQDDEVIRRVMDGDVNAFEYFIKRYKQAVIRTLMRHIPYDDIEETAHEVFVRAYCSLKSYKGKSSFKTWLSAISVRTCYDFWRKRYRVREVSMSSLDEKHSEWIETALSDHTEDALDKKFRKKEARDLLDGVLSKLSPEDKMVVELVYLEGLSGKEAAQLLGWSVANVKVRSFRSRQKIKGLLTKLIKKNISKTE